MVQEHLSSLIPDRRGNTQKHRAATLDFRPDKPDQGIPAKDARRVDNVEFKPALRKARRNAPALPSDNVDEDTAAVRTPVVVQISHAAPAAMPFLANRRSAFIDSAPD